MKYERNKKEEKSKKEKIKYKIRRIEKQIAQIKNIKKTFSILI